MVGVGLGGVTTWRNCDESRREADKLLIKPTGGSGRRPRPADISGARQPLMGRQLCCESCRITSAEPGSNPSRAAEELSQLCFPQAMSTGPPVPSAERWATREQGVAWARAACTARRSAPGIGSAPQIHQGAGRAEHARQDRALLRPGPRLLGVARTPGCDRMLLSLPPVRRGAHRTHSFASCACLARLRESPRSGEH